MPSPLGVFSLPEKISATAGNEISGISSGISVSLILATAESIPVIFNAISIFT